MTPDPPRWHPATPTQIAACRPIAEAPREYRLIVLLWRDADEWQAIYGWWDEDAQNWRADAALTGSADIPTTPTHWCKA